MAESEKWRPWVEDIEDPYTRGLTAFLMETEERYAKIGLHNSGLFTEGHCYFGNRDLHPTLLCLSCGASFPNLIANEIVSMQPMMGPTSVVFYMKLVAGSDKGRTVRGQELARQHDENYGSEAIEGESLGETNASGVFNTTDSTANLSYTPIRPGTVTLTIGDILVVVDDGDGNLVKQSGSGALAAGAEVDYTTGVVTLDHDGAALEVTADYRYDSESNYPNADGSGGIPEVDISITSSPVVARPRKLRSRWSMEAAHNLRAVHGIDADSEIGAQLVSEIRFEIDREVISQLQSIASAGQVSFNRVPTTGLGLDEHLRSFKNTLINAGGLIYNATRRAEGNWAVFGREGADIVEVLPGYSSSGMTGQHGVLNMGTIDGRWTAYRDSYMGAQDFLVGHKGMSFMDTGYILATYVMLYSTPTVILDDFTARRGLGSLYAKKVVDSRYYATRSDYDQVSSPKNQLNGS